MGRPPKQDDVVPTRERLVAASIEVFVEQGFSQASLSAIAERSGISGPAVYKHFDSKADLLMEAARQSLERALESTAVSGWSPHDMARRWLADDFATTRRLRLALHVATELLAAWHHERTRAWQAERPDSIDRIKAFYLLLMGLAHVDALAALSADPGVLAGHVDRMVDALFPDPDPDPDRDPHPGPRTERT
jgi:AcrR family transcriptional regulator